MRRFRTFFSCALLTVAIGCETDRPLGTATADMTGPDLAGTPPRGGLCGALVTPTTIQCGPDEFCFVLAGGFGQRVSQCASISECDGTPTCDCIVRHNNLGCTDKGGCGCGIMDGTFWCYCP